MQNLRSGVLELLEVPCPKVSTGHLLIQSRASLISAGTERSLVEFGKANLLAKAKQNPDRVKQVLDKIRSDGLLPTLEAVFTKLDEPLPLGYCNAGTVLQVGDGVCGFNVGDRVVSNGPHAEVVNVPMNLCARIPAGVPDVEACFAVLGSISLQGIRLLRPALGESAAVFGLGLVGQLAVQLLSASGVRVLGLDLDSSRLAMAEQFGAITGDLSVGTDPVRLAETFSGGHGVDSVLITASAKNDDIINQAARMARKRGRIVMVGVTNLELDRAVFYEKELSFQVSCSYGPGRYDPNYEQKGLDYPYAYVRWTQQRNIQAVLDMMTAKKLCVDPLITQRIPHAEAPSAYQLLSSDRSQMAIVLEYPSATAPMERVVSRSAKPPRSARGEKAIVGIIGAGSFTKAVLLPALSRTGARLASVASGGGVSAAHAARKFAVDASTSDYRTILDDSRINTVFIATRHHQHARMVVESLQAGKHVFVEKPLAIDEQGLCQVRCALEATDGQQLMVGFNRRFSPHAVRIKQLLDGRSQPVCMTMTVNAGRIPPDHWVHDPKIGGGRIVGEGCHWIDLLSFLIGSPASLHAASCVGQASGGPRNTDEASVLLRFGDGSIGTLHYFANGHRTYPKEKLNIFCEGKTLELDNFRVLRGYGWPNFRRMKLMRQNKGHRAEVAQFVQHIESGGPPLIAADDLWRVTRISIQAENAVHQLSEQV